MAASGISGAPERLPSFAGGVSFAAFPVLAVASTYPGDADTRRCDVHVAQQLGNLVHRPGDRDAGLAGFELALDLDERAVRGVKSTSEDGRDVKRGRRIARKQSRCVGDTELRSFEGPHVGCMGLIQQSGQLAEYRARLGNPGDLRSLFGNLHQTLPKEQQFSGGFAGGNHRLSRFVRRDG